MSPEEFRMKWCAQADEELVGYSAKAVDALKIPAESKRFLKVAGLPDSAAPFLDFEYDAKRGAIPTIVEVWKLPPTYDCYRVIGWNGSGDPVCLDESKAGEVVYLNHDNEFQRVFVNTSVERLAGCLLVFREMVARAQLERGQDAYLNADVPENVLEWAKKEIARIDEKALLDDAMWECEFTQCNMKE